jgi:hypothetical protein
MATRDFEQPNMPLVIAPIVIGDGAWVTADVFIGPGVTVDEGASDRCVRHRRQGCRTVDGRRG